MQYKIQSSKCCRAGIAAEGCANCLCRELNTFDYLADLPAGCQVEDFVEIQFKRTRKGYYLNTEHLPLKKGDMVTVEASPGHDIGEVTLTGHLVERQMKKIRYRNPKGGPQKIYRKASESDMNRFREVKALEQGVMIRSRQIAQDLGLEMKIGDVEYQGDGQKAIFYYIADGRVDFRQLIKELAANFRIRVEMRQIGVRQEAGRIGGIGPCGRTLCCASWLSNFVSVGTQAARLQDFSMNPQKLAGQCGKLKCCINFEVDSYFEARQKLPSKEVTLETEVGTYKMLKYDILSGDVSYVLQSQKRNEPLDPITISSERAHQVIEENKRGRRPFSLIHDEEEHYAEMKREKSMDILAESSLTRFDEEEENRPKRSRKRNRNRNRKRADSQQDQVPNNQVAKGSGEEKKENRRRYSRSKKGRINRSGTKPSSDSRAGQKRSTP